MPFEVSKAAIILQVLSSLPLSCSLHIHFQVDLCKTYQGRDHSQSDKFSIHLILSEVHGAWRVSSSSKTLDLIQDVSLSKSDAISYPLLGDSLFVISNFKLTQRPNQFIIVA